ncbi:hypothetical protein O9992_25155 [Vibrio lentus]|nr:hypothetical protein [Vibrio lentus]
MVRIQKATTVEECYEWHSWLENRSLQPKWRTLDDPRRKCGIV